MDSSIPGAGGARFHVSFRTMCGREIQVGHLVLGGGRHPAQRISLNIGASPGTGAGTWAGLTVGEARRLAAALLTQAAACDPARRPEQGASSRLIGSGMGQHLLAGPAAETLGGAGTCGRDLCPRFRAIRRYLVTPAVSWMESGRR